MLLVEGTTTKLVKQIVLMMMQFPHVGDDFDFVTTAPKPAGQVSALTAQRLQKQAPRYAHLVLNPRPKIYSNLPKICSLRTI